MKQTLVLISFLFTGIVYSQNYSKSIDFNRLNIQFEDASAELKPEYIPLIYRLSDTLRRTPDLHVTIRGHVCCVNRNRLAKRRAKVVKEYLVLFGVKPHQITTVGMKNSMPVVFPEKTKADELANMRVDFVLRKD